MKNKCIVFTSSFVLVVVSVLCFGYTKKVCDDTPIETVRKEYDTVLAEYRHVITGVLSDSFEKDFIEGNFISPDSKLNYEWSAMIIDAKEGLSSPQKSSFGYILQDINNDNVEELFLVRCDHTILAIFTIVEDKPELLDAFWSRHKGCVLVSGQIYILDSNGAQDFEYSINEVCGELIAIRKFGCDNGIFYKMTNNKKEIITQQEFDKMIETYPFESTNEWFEKPINLLK